MKITIDLSDTDVRAIKAYLKSFGDDVTKVSKEDIKVEIMGAIDGHLQSGALGDYYRIEADKDQQQFKTI